MGRMVGWEGSEHQATFILWGLVFVRWCFHKHEDMAEVRYTSLKTGGWRRTRVGGLMLECRVQAP